MISLGCNYSKQLVNLLNKDAALVDWIKLSHSAVFEQQAATAKLLKPILLHFFPRATGDFEEGWDMERLGKALTECGSPHVASHLRPVSADFGGENLSKDELVELIVSRLKEWKAKVKAELLIENMPYHAVSEELRFITTPEVISTICEKAGVGLLLDLAHLRCTAWYLQEDELSCLKRFPLHLVRELHVSSPGMGDKRGLLDLHLEMKEEDYSLLEKVLSYTKPEVVTLEYGGEGQDYKGKSDGAAIKTQLLRLREMTLTKAAGRGNIFL